MQTRTLLSLLLLAAPLAAQTPVDLNSWTQESYDASGFPDGLWTPAVDGSSVIQSVNGDPTLFVGDFEALDAAVEGRIRMGNSGDDDLVGFAIGFLPGDSTNSAAEYLLIDWKRSTQSFNFNAPACTPGSTSTVGLAVSRVTGIPTADELWGHTNFDAACSDLANGVSELARATTLGSTPWVFDQDYVFRFEITNSHLRLFVDGVLEFDLAVSVPGGRLAFYNFSQNQVNYSAFTFACLGSWESYGAGWPGTNGIPTMTLDAPPTIGSTTMLNLGNSLGSPTDAFVFQARGASALDIGLGGDLLLAAPFFLRDVVSPLPVGGAVVPIAVPDDTALCAQEFYLQAFLLDPGASNGVSLTPGIRAVVGE